MFNFVSILIFISAAVLGAEIISPILFWFYTQQQKRAEQAAEKMENMFVRVRLRNFVLLYTLLPIILAILGYTLFHSLLAVLAGIAMGLIIPGARIKAKESGRRRQFQKQLIDSLMILSSSLKGGLSLIQALEVLVEEMPPPISQEFGMVLAENKIGLSLEESFAHLYKRMPLDELNQLITAVLLARETGGNLPAIFNRLVYTMRENYRIIQQIQNLTIQGRLQGIIMCAIPIVFAIVVYTMNPTMFDEMLQSDLGRGLLIYSVFSQLIGMFLIRKLSKLDF
jgi:tight adherence protein B